MYLRPPRGGSSLRRTAPLTREGVTCPKHTNRFQSTSVPHLTEDEKHLARLGYKQDLNRSWSGFSNFAISFSIISILAGCFTNFGAGFNNGGPISISWSWPILGLFILHHRVHDVRAGVGVPDVRRHLLVGLEARRPGGRLLHRLAEPDRPDRGHRGCVLRLRDLHRPDDQHLLDVVRRQLLADPRLPDLRGRPGGCLGAEHLQRSPDGDHEQRLGVVARGRRRGHRADPGLRARPAPELQLRLHRTRSTTPGTTAEAPAASPSGSRSSRSASCSRSTRSPGFDASRPPVRGDLDGRPRRRRRGSGARSSTRSSAATSCCSPWSSRSRTTPRASRTTRWPARAWRRSSSVRWAPTGPRSCSSSRLRRSSTAPRRA